MTNPTSDGGTILKTLPGARPWKVRAVYRADLQEHVLGHRIVGAGSRDHQLTTMPNNNDADLTRAAPLNNTSAEATGKKRFP
jgi:hypothetical protein